MARDRAAFAEALRDGPAARLADARDRQRLLLCHAGGLPVAPAAERLAALGDDLPASVMLLVRSDRSCFMTFETDSELGAASKRLGRV